MNGYMVFEFVATMIENYLCYFFCGTFIKGEKSNPLLLCAGTLIGAGIATWLNKTNLFAYMNFIAAIVTLILYVYVLLKRQLGFISALVLLYLVIISAIDFHVAQIGALLTGIPANVLLSAYGTQRLFCMAASKLLLLLVVLFIRKVYRMQKNLNRKYVAGLCVLSFGIVTSNYVMVSMAPGMTMDALQLLIAIYFIGSMILIFGIFYILLVVSDNYEQKQNVALLELQNEMIVKAQKDSEQIFMLWRKSIHDYKNQMIALRQMVQQDEKEAVMQYLDEQYELMNTQLFHIKTGNTVVDAILQTKQNIAQSKGIVVVLNAVFPNPCYIRNMDLAVLLGNLLDNAIEAAQKAKQPYMEIIVRSEGNLLMIKISNTMCGSFHQEMTTTKQDKVHHGIGMKSIKNIVKQYNGQYDMKQEQELVTATVLLLNMPISE